MAKPGLSLDNNLYAGSGGLPEAFVNPYAPPSPVASPGLAGIQPGAETVAAMGTAARGALSSFIGAQQPQTPRLGQDNIFFDPQRKVFWANGVEVAEQDDRRIAETAPLLDQPSVGAPTGGNWTAIPGPQYRQIVQSIVQPSRGELLSRNFAIGAQQLKQFGGSALQLAGAEQLGGRIAESAQQRLEQLSPYQREFTGVEFGSADKGIVDWFVANLGQVGPSMLESVATGLIGAAAGSATAGPGLGTAGGFLAGVFGKKAFKDSVLAAAQKYRASGAAALNPTETQLLKNASALAGATIANFAGSQVMGAGDIYGEMRQQGAGPEDFNARMAALAGSFPYALAESSTEFLLAGRVLGGLAAPRAMAAGTSVPRRGVELLRRGAVGGAVGGALEGATELGQEALVMGLSGQSLTDDEAVKRFINSFAAGAAVGGTIGGIANLRGRNPDGTPSTEAKQETNLLDATGTSAAPTLPANAPRGTQGALFTEQQAPAPAGPSQLGQLGQDPVEQRDALLNERQRLTQFVAQAQTELQAMAGGQAAFDANRVNVLRGQIAGVQGAVQQIDQQLQQYAGLPGMGLAAAQGQQGQLGLFQDRPVDLASGTAIAAPGTQGELFTARQAPSPVGPPRPMLPGETAAGVPEFNSAQGALQFAPPAPAPAPNTLMAQQIQAAQRRQQAEQAYQQRAQQEAAQREAELQQLAVQAENQRQLDIAAQQTAPSAPAPMPMRPAGPTQPEQLPLFKTRKQAPVPSRAEGLRRGVGTQIPEPTGTTPLTAAEKRKQGNLFTTPSSPKETAQPTVAALRSAGKRRKLAAMRPKSRATTTVGARGLKKGARVAEVNVTETPSAAQEGKLKQGRVAERQQDNAGVQGGRDAGNKPASKVKAGGAQAGGGGKPVVSGAVKAETLKRGKAKEVTKPPKVVAAPAAAPVLPEKVPPKPAATLSAEEQWNEERLPGDIAFADLPQSAKTAWETSDRSGAAQIVIQEQLDDDILPMSETERLNYNIARADEAIKVSDLTALADAIDNVVETAFFSDETQQAKPRIAEAQAYLNDTTFTDAQQAVINEAFLLSAEGQALDAYYKGGSKKGAVTPWFEYASRQSGLIQRLAKASVKFTNMSVDQAKALLDAGSITTLNLPDSTVKALGKPKLSTEKAAGSDPKNSPATKLAAKIREINSHTGMPYTKAVRTKRIAELTALWKQVRDADLQTPEVDALLGQPLDAFFDGDGKPFSGTVKNQLRIGTEEMTKAVQAKMEKAIDEAVVEDVYESPFTLDDWETSRNISDSDTRFSTADGKRITKPVAVGRVRMLVNRFRSRLLVKPDIQVFANQADLKAKNPKLYARAAASRPQGDFDTANAVGVSFGNNIVIFSDRVATEDQLNFVLAHETVGHFGLRSLIPAKKFDALMESIYDQSPAVRAGADAAMLTRDMGKAEAVEEYLSDFAAELDVGLVSRIWNAIKDALNKLGVKFGDDAARYWVNQARRYVRNGEVSHAFRTSETFEQMAALEGGLDPGNVGRFALSGNLRVDNMAADFMSDTTGSMPENIADASKRFRNLVGDSFSSVDKFKSRFFSLFNYRARENPGLSELDRILSNGRGYTMSIKNAANENMAVVLNRAVASSVAGWAGVGGITEAQVTQVNKMLYDAQRQAVAKLKSSDLGTTPLFTVASDGTVVPNTTELDRVYKLGLLTFEQARDGYSYDVTYDEGGKSVTEKVKVAGIADLDEQGPVWQGYLRTRETLREVEMQLLRARYAAATQDRDLAFREIGDATTAKKLTAADQRFLERMYRKYRDMWTANPVTDEDGNPAFNPKSIENANDFLVKLNTALIGKGTDRNADVAAFFEGAVADDAIASLNDFKTRLVLDEENKFLVQNRMKDIIVSEVSNDGADLYTKDTLASGYVPVLREGEAQVRVVATTASGKPVRLKQSYKEQLVFSQVATDSEAVDLATKINDLFGNKTYTVEGYSEDTQQYEVMSVRLRAVSEKALTEIAAPPQLNLNEFIRGLRQFSIALPPEKLKEVIVALTRQNSSARNRLKRAFTPGASPDALKAISQHIESRASTSAKILMRPKINELMNLNLSTTQRLWNGDKAKLDQLKANYDQAMADPQATSEQRLQAKREYEVYNFQYQKTNPKGGVQRGNQYYNEAANTLAFLDSNRNVGESDYESGAVVSNIRMYTSLLQLGGSIATGVLNYIGAVTNGIPYLATYSDKTAFGGGFGLGRSVAEFQRALGQVGLLRALPGIGEKGLNTAEFYDDIVASKELQRKFGLTAQEARFMATQIRSGEMIPAQTNSLVGSSRGRVTTGAGQKAIDGYMWTFNVTEQGARRGLGLAAYRLQYERSIAAGMTEADAAAAASDFAVSTLRYTLGDYSVLNRPPAWRSGLPSFVYMYKVFVTTSIQMLSRLPRDGQLYMLGALWLLGGVMAFPFADDLEDMIDTIAQALGLKMPSVQAQLAKTIDAVAPGMSPYVLRGFANAALGINLADRISLSDFIPGTGILLSGADVGRELTEIAGPAASMLTGVASSIPRFTQAAFTERVTFVDAFRESPVTMLRALGDTIAYGQAGAVIDKRGYVVSPDVNAGLMAARMLGFYPAEAAEQYNIIRISKRITDYQKDTVAGFRTAWIKAKVGGDTEQVRAIEQAVRDWNEGSKGTALEIRNFTANAQRALREAQRPAGERLLRAAPVAAREELEQIADLLGYND